MFEAWGHQRRRTTQRAQEERPAASVREAEREWPVAEHEALRDYLEAHGLLQGQPEAVPEEEVAAIAAQLLEPATSLEDKRRVLIFLAHHKSAAACDELRLFLERAPVELERFARLALEEARQWSLQRRLHGPRNGPCPCGSGRKLKSCCGGGTP